jgi:hypothetical protein
MLRRRTLPEEVGELYHFITPTIVVKKITPFAGRQGDTTPLLLSSGGSSLSAFALTNPMNKAQPAKKQQPMVAEQAVVSEASPAYPRRRPEKPLQPVAPPWFSNLKFPISNTPDVLRYLMAAGRNGVGAALG